MIEVTNERSDRYPDARWYVVHTYSGHENKVKTTMEQMVKNRGMEDIIFEISVPTEQFTEKKEGVEKVKERKIFPSYVLVHMIMTDESWYLVRNTRGVTGFVGPGSKPVPLTKAEEMALGVTEPKAPEYDYNVDDSVKVITGPFKDFLGKIESIDDEKAKLRVFISMFGRDTKLELDYNQVEKL